jgi:hypothetical protein
MKLDKNFVADKNNPVYVYVQSLGKRILLHYYDSHIDFVFGYDTDKYLNNKDYFVGTACHHDWQPIPEPHPFDKYKKTGWVKHNKSGNLLMITGYAYDTNEICLAGTDWNKVSTIGTFCTPCPAPKPQGEGE